MKFSSRNGWKLSLSFVFYCIIGFYTSVIHAQDTIPVAPKVKAPPIDSTIVSYFGRTYDSLANGFVHFVDTNLLLVSRFDALSKQSDPIQTLSNAGLAHQSMVFRPEFLNGFDMKRNPYGAFVHNSQSVKYLDPTAPITEIGYLMGAKKEQQLNVLFGRQLAPRLFVGMNFELVDSRGPYKNNSTTNSSVYFTARYKTKDSRYGVLANYFNNRLSMAENGGIVNDSDFENNTEFDRRVIAVNLEKAYNKYKQSGFGFEHYFILLPEKRQTSDSTSVHRRFQLGRITHQFEYQRNQSIYSEALPLAAFYQPFDIVLDSTETYDSTYQSVVRNRFYWSTLGYRTHKKDNPFHLFAGVELANSLNSDSLYKQKIWQINPYGGINIALFKSFYLNGSAKLITGNQSAGDFEVYGKLRQFLGTEQRNLGNLFFSIRLINQSPSWFYERYQSNHFRWDQKLEKSTFFTLNGGYKFKDFEAGAESHIIDKYVFLNAEARAMQTSGTIKILRLFANLHFSPGKFDIIANANYQLSDNDTIISLPTLTAKLRLAFSQQLFNNAAIFQPGIEAYWFTSYYADAYMPALRAFYPQREKAIGIYPFVDVYISLKVKRARIFLQYNNLFGLAGQYNYYTTLHYPARDPRFNFGVSWRFYQ